MKMKKEDKINVIMNSLYDYQLEALNACNLHGNRKGIVCLPTGTGKTRIQAALIASDIIKNSGFRMYVINAPRIMLSYQLMREVYSFLINFGIEARYMAVHSGGEVDTKEFEEIRTRYNESTEDEILYSQIAHGTSTTIIKDMMLKAESQKLPVIFFSTYNSVDRIEAARIGMSKSISIVVNDEAQYLIQERFYPILGVLKTNRCYFFTATMIHTTSCSGRGMNNEESYGKVIYQMIPREAIDRGKMVRPRMHMVLLKDKNKIYGRVDFENSLGHIIRESYLQHEYALRGVAPKILISVRGVGEIKKFLDSKECSILKNNGVDIFAVASNDQIGNNINGVKTTRQDFLKQLKINGLDKTKRMIVLHYDILAEGIDVSGFTGILPLRSLGKTKFLQTYGRATRLDPFDRSRLESGEIKPDDLDFFNKPYAWIIVPSIIEENNDNREDIENLVNELRDHGFNPVEDIVVSDEGDGLPPVVGPEGLNKLKKKCPSIIKTIEEVEASYEDERLASLSDEDWLDELNEVLED